MKRRRFFNYIVRDLAKIPEAQLLPKWILLIQWFLFPLRTFRYYDGFDGYNIMNDTWNIDGVIIDGQYFWKIKSNIGKRFEVLRNDEGIITLREISNEKP